MITTAQLLAASVLLGINQRRLAVRCGSSGSHSLFMIASFRRAYRADVRALCSLSESLPPTRHIFNCWNCAIQQQAYVFGSMQSRQTSGKQQEGS